MTESFLCAQPLLYDHIPFYVTTSPSMWPHPLLYNRIPFYVTASPSALQFDLHPSVLFSFLISVFCTLLIYCFSSFSSSVFLFFAFIRFFTSSFIVDKGSKKVSWQVLFVWKVGICTLAFQTIVFFLFWNPIPSMPYTEQEKRRLLSNCPFLFSVSSFFLFLLLLLLILFSFFPLWAAAPKRPMSLDFKHGGNSTSSFFLSTRLLTRGSNLSINHEPLQSHCALLSHPKMHQLWANAYWWPSDPCFLSFCLFIYLFVCFF